MTLTVEDLKEANDKREDEAKIRRAVEHSAVSGSSGSEGRPADRAPGAQ